MSALAANKLKLIEALAQSAPDRALANLEQALATAPGQSGPMGEVRRVLASEAEHRRIRDAVLAPIRPLFGRDDRMGLSFPPGVLRALWPAIHVLAPNEAAAAVDQIRQATPDQREFETACDALCLAASEALNSDDANPFTKIRGDLGPARAAKLATCLALVPVSRKALEHLREWLGRMDGERAAVARLLYKDACEAADDAGPCLVEILCAHIDDPSQVLRLISAFMDRPPDSYAASSELAPFGERVLAQIDSRIETLKTFDPRGGVVAGQAAGAAVHRAVIEIETFEQAIELTKTGAWSARILQHKRALADLVEMRLRKAEEAVAAALPVQTGFGKAARGHPKLNADVDPVKAGQARAMTAFIQAVHTASATAGFGASRARAAEKIQVRLDQYVEDLLTILREHPESEQLARIQAHLELAGDCLGDVTEGDAAQIVRRRAAAA
ncbi:MAG: hypothetical protein ACXW3D_10805 [Caulobacteraceae bacterium]